MKPICFVSHDSDHFFLFPMILRMGMPVWENIRLFAHNMHISLGYLGILSLQEQKELDAVTYRDFYMHSDGANALLWAWSSDHPGNQQTPGEATPP